MRLRLMGRLLWLVAPFAVLLAVVVDATTWIFILLLVVALVRVVLDVKAALRSPEA